MAALSSDVVATSMNLLCQSERRRLTMAAVTKMATHTAAPITGNWSRTAGNLRFATTLERIADASRAAAYGASDPASIDKVFAEVISNF